jgi:hypothetical protein
VSVKLRRIRYREQQILYYDGLHFADAKQRKQPLPPTAVVGFVGFKREAGIPKNRSLAANIDADRALISFKEMPITLVQANYDAGEVACREIGALAVEGAALINDSEHGQNPTLLGIVEVNGFIREPSRNRPHGHRSFLCILASRFHEARFVRITDGRLPIWLDPFGMLEPQVVVNLLAKLGVGVDLVRRHR